MDEPGYYGIPLLKPPKWKWAIALYFFFEGISAGSYLLGTMADLFARGRYPPLVRNSRYLAIATLAPCPPPLIADLGRPERFLHMLRVVKRTSPMNTGAWALTFYGQFAAALAVREFWSRASAPLKTRPVRGTASPSPHRTVEHQWGRAVPCSEAARGF